MRIAHVSDFCLPRVGGIEVQIAGLAEHQRAAGHRVDVLTALEGNGTPLARLRPSAIRDVADAVRGGRYDMVHVHAGVFTPIAFAALVTASRAGTPTVVTAHSLLHQVRTPFRVLDAAVRWTRFPVAWTAVSGLAAAPVQRLVGPENPVHVLPNAIDLATWKVDPLPRDPEHVVIAAVGRLAARKRPLPLLRSLRRARAQVPADIRMSAVIAGDGPQRGACERAIDRAGMHDWVHLTGPLPHDSIRALHRRADVFVAPALLESFGIAALEARAAGLPVVAMAGGGVGTFIEHGREGLLVDDDRGLASAIAELTIDVPAREGMTAHNRVRTPDLGWDQALARTELEYVRAEAISGDRARRPARVRQVVRADAGP